MRAALALLEASVVSGGPGYPGAAAPGAVRDAKALVDMVAGREINDDLLRKTAHQIADRRVSDEGREGLAAFLEKRKPYWAD